MTTVATNVFLVIAGPVSIHRSPSAPENLLRRPVLRPADSA